MRKSLLKLYAPFLVLALVQAAFIAFAPSKGPESQDVAAFEGGAPGAAAGATGDIGAGGGTGNTGVGDDGAVAGGTGGDVGAVGGETGGGTGETGGGGTGSTGGGGGGGPAAQATGDIGHCKGQYQFDVLFANPPCKPKWTGGQNNGGTTYQGVTKDKIRIVFFGSKPNPQVDAILASQGLAVPEADRMDFVNTAVNFIRKNYNLYGRDIELIRRVGDCPTTPPDYPTCTAEARKLLELKPFAIIFATPLYGTVFDVWARAGIVSFGGWHFDNSYFVGRRPYRYDIFMDGTQSADLIAEYYCKKMAGKKASHSGRVIHPTVGNRGSAQRKLGIVVPEIDANVRTAKRVQQLVAKCDGGRTPYLSTYESDIERANEQTEATVNGMIASKVTTVVCMCDPIAPAFLTAGMTKQGFFPEFLQPGLGLLDYDLLGRLYDKQQMAHTFGPSHLQTLVDLDQTDAARVWRAMGRQGHPCGDNGCGIEWGYLSLIATAIHNNGPTLNPINLEKSMFAIPPRGGDRPGTTLVKFGPNDYTALSDAKEIYWSENTRSAVDGKPGAYVPLSGGKRYQNGQWPAAFHSGIPVAPN